MSEKNYQEYVYPQGAKIEIPKEVFEEFQAILNDVIIEGTTISYKEHYLFVNKETGKEVKSVKEEDLISGKVVKIPDTEKLLTTEPERYYSPKAMRAINLTLSLNAIHVEHVDKGVAKHYTELQNN